jgi:hypothetical protein
MFTPNCVRPAARPSRLRARPFTARSNGGGYPVERSSDTERMSIFGIVPVPHAETAVARRFDCGSVWALEETATPCSRKRSTASFGAWDSDNAAAARKPSQRLPVLRSSGPAFKELLRSTPALYRRKWVMWVRRHFELDIVARANLTIPQDNRHDSGFANDGSVDVTIQRRGH